MQDKLKEILKSWEIADDTIECILSDFTDEYVLKADADAMLLEEKQQLVLDSEVTSQLKEYKSKNDVACKALIDFSKLYFDAYDKLCGLKEQLEMIKKDNPFLFDTEPEYAPKGSTNMQNYDDLSDDEYFNFLKYRGE